VTGARNVKGGFALLGVGLLAGLGMSLYAFKPMVPVPGPLEHYDDLPRRLFRLGHIAAVMLPLINIAIGSWLDRLRLTSRAKEVSSWLMLLGGIGLPLTLTLEALVPTVIGLHLSALPAVAFTAGVLVAGVGAMRTEFHEEGCDGSHERCGTKGLRDRAEALQESRRA